MKYKEKQKARFHVLTRRFQYSLIAKLLEAHKNNVSAVSEILGISRNTLYSVMSDALKEQVL